MSIIILMLAVVTYYLMGIAVYALSIMHYAKYDSVPNYTWIEAFLLMTVWPGLLFLIIVDFIGLKIQAYRRGKK